MKKPIHEKLSEKNNKSKTQEVHYKKDFKQAKETEKNINNKMNM